MELFFGFYFGTLTMIVLYNLHWYKITKERSYLFYAISKIFMILTIFLAAPIIENSQFLLILNVSLLLIFMLLFTREFLALHKHFPKLDQIAKILALGLIGCFLYSVISGDYSIYQIPYSLAFAPLIVLGYFVYRSGYKPAIYYTVAWGISDTLIGINDLNTYNIISFYAHVPFDLIGHIVESIILSYAISVKTDLLMQEKEAQSKILIHQAKLASMGQMLENISHQWRQPLNRISTFIINMQMHIRKEYEQDAYLNEALTQSQLQLEYMSNTINDFTRFNQQSGDKATFMASAAVDDAKNILASSLEANKISFEIETREDFSIFSYQNELAQVVLNLIQNAQDALLENKIEAALIKVSISKNNICVQDNAGGIAVEIAQKIFEPYFTTKGKSTSLGLGLYMSKIILEKHFNAKIELVQREQTTAFEIIFS